MNDGEGEADARVAAEPAGCCARAHVYERVYEYVSGSNAPELFPDESATVAPGAAVAGAVMDATDRETACSAFTLPFPQVLFGADTPAGSVAVFVSRARIWAPVSDGLELHTSAAIPATCGVAMLVPCKIA